MACILITLNNLKTKVRDLNVDKLKTITVILKNISDVASKEVVKKKVCNKLNSKVNNLQNTVSDANTLIHINHYNTGRQSLEKKMHLTLMV